MTTIPDRVKNNLWFAYFSVLVTWTFMAFREIGLYLAKGTLFARVLDGKPYINDTVHWYNAALLARQCLSGKINLYDPLIQDRSVRSITAPVVPEGLLYLQYPPQFFTLMLPFSYFPITAAYFVWCGLALVLICISLRYLLKETILPGFARWFAFVGIMSCFPAWLSFELGQTSLYQLPATICFWLLLRRQHFFAAGLLTALLTVKIQYLPVLGLAGLILGKGRYLAGALLSTTLLVCATYALVGWENMVAWPQALKFGETDPRVVGVGAESMQNFRGTLVLLMGGDIPLVHVLSMVAFAASILALALMWWRGYPALRNKLAENAFGVCVTVSILVSLSFSPHTHYQEYFSAAAALVFLYPATLHLNKTFWSKTLKVLVIGFPVWSWIFYLLRPLFTAMYVQPYFLWSVSVLVLILLSLRSSETPRTAP